MQEPTHTESGNDHYRSIAGAYDLLLGPLLSPLRTIGLEMHPVSSSTSVLDVGCGTGAQLEIYADSGATCTGIDSSLGMLEQAVGKLGDRANLELGDATDLPYENSSFDLVITSLFLHELNQERGVTVLNEMMRVMKLEGRLLVIDYNPGPLRPFGVITRMAATLAERIAGSDHYNNWRAYLLSGGLPTLASIVGLTIEDERCTTGGNFSLWLLKS